MTTTSHVWPDSSSSRRLSCSSSRGSESTSATLTPCSESSSAVHATALASAKVATRDPGDRMEVWEEAIKKAVEKKETVNEPYP